ncbi:MAG TPA: efflux RND transporter periplasmic adaptor subunit [Bacillota bacterium]|nr:efflux RND transporter periplasmic adaptor subunit [Bacillota bacterium]
MKKRVKWAAGILWVMGLMGYMIYGALKPLDAELLKVQKQTVSQSFKEEGIVTAATERPIYSLISGEILSLKLKEGQTVKKGDQLASIESKDLEYQLQQLQAQEMSLSGQEKKSAQDIEQQLGQLKGQLESIQGQEKQANRSPYQAQINQQQLVVDETKRQLEQSKEDYSKIKTLYENHAVSKNEWDHAERAVEQLENNLKQQEQALSLIGEQASPISGTDQYYSGLKNAIQTQIKILTQELEQGPNGTGNNREYYQGLKEAVDAQIHQVEYQLANRNIVSPIDGMIKEWSVKEGTMVKPQTPLLTLTSLNDLEVKVYVLTEDVIGVKEGMKVKLVQKRKDKDYTFAGTVKAIAPAAEEKISAFGLTQQKVKVTIEPDDQMAEWKPGYALDVVFTTLEEPNQLAVPKSALFPYEDGEALWTVRNGKAVIQKVQKGMETDELAVIENGLNEGDVVIKNPEQEGLKPGKRVSEPKGK